MSSVYRQKDHGFAIQMRLILHLVQKNLVLGVIGLVVFFIFLDFSYLKLNTADASVYLSTAKNIADHKGFVVSYNLSQSFNTLYHPVLPYYQPLYSFFSSLFINHGGIVKVIQINILFFALNAMLIFYIIQELIPTRFNVLFIFFLVFSHSFFDSALYAWTEQFYFFNFIITFILFLKFLRSPGHLAWLGFLNGVLMLVRVAHLFNVLAYLPVIFIGKDPLRQKACRAFFFIGGFILAYGLYQLFCLYFYHVFYPEYARPGASYGLARYTSGVIYSLNQVGIQIFLGSFFSLKNFLSIGEHVRDFFHFLPLFLSPALFYYFLPASKRQDGGLVALCFSQSIFAILGYSASFYWVPHFSDFEFLRYSLLPYVLMSVAGWYCLYQGLSFFEPLGRQVTTGLVFLSLLYPQVEKFIAFKSDLFRHPLWERPYYKDLMESCNWIDRNLPREVLVASNEDQQGYFMHRPYISTPPGKSFNCANLALYNRIYSPDYYLLSRAITDKCFTSIPHTVIFSNKTFRLYKVNSFSRRENHVH